MGEWLYYNLAAGSLHTKNLCSRFYSFEIEFYKKTKNRFLSHPLLETWGNVCNPYISRWKARSRLPIRHN